MSIINLIIMAFLYGIVGFVSGWLFANIAFTLILGVLPQHTDSNTDETGNENGAVL